MKTARLLLGFAILCGLTAFAQEFPRVEVAAMYSYSRFSPSSIYATGMNLNGGGGSVTINIDDYFGIKADLRGYAGSQAAFTIPKGDPTVPAGASGKASGNLFTYMFGPQLKMRHGRFHPYVHALFGAAHTSAYANAEKAACSGACQPSITTSSVKASQNAFAMALGGGVDVRMNKHVSLRLGEFDYLGTRFSNYWDVHNQNNFRYSAGVVFTFGD